MKTILFGLLIAISYFFILSSGVYALDAGEECTTNRSGCATGLICQPSTTRPGTYFCDVQTLNSGEECTTNRRGCSSGLTCVPSTTSPGKYFCDVTPGGGTPGGGGGSSGTGSDAFGKIQTPDALKGLVNKDPSGSGGLGIFLSNLINLFYVIAAVVLIFMLLWGAFDWITSEGNKEKVESARNKIINALVGILLFAAAFGVIKVLGQFTGFQFFVGQNSSSSKVPDPGLDIGSTNKHLVP